jgi:dTDP-4-amino-4,6-dideoxygalactose transaminase
MNSRTFARAPGGLLLFRDRERRSEINQLAFLGLVADTFNRTIATGVSPTQQVARIGHKYKIDDLAAAVALASVEQLDGIVSLRARLVERYYERLEALPQVELMRRRTNAAVSWYIFPIRVAVAARDSLRAYLAEHNVDSTVHYPSLLEQPAFKDCRGAAPVVARESRRILSLPLHCNLNVDEIDRICDAVQEYLA